MIVLNKKFNLKHKSRGKILHVKVQNLNYDIVKNKIHKDYIHITSNFYVIYRFRLVSDFIVFKISFKIYNGAVNLNT